MRRLMINESLCIGCYACSGICEYEVVTVEDGEMERKIRVLKDCNEECRACEGICPTKAITFTDEISGGYQEIVFTMLSCVECGLPVAPERMINFLSKRIPADLVDMRVCVECRRRMTNEALRI